MGVFFCEKTENRGFCPLRIVQTPFFGVLSCPQSMDIYNLHFRRAVVNMVTIIAPTRHYAVVFLFFGRIVAVALQVQA